MRSGSDAGWRNNLRTDEKEQKTDALLVAEYLDAGRSRQQRDDSFAAIVEKHSGMVYSACLRTLNGNSSQAEEATQSVFVALSTAAESIKKTGSLSSWLLSVARNASIAIIRRDSVRKDKEKEASMLYCAETESDREGLWAEIRPLLNDTISRLSPRLQPIVVLRLLEGRSFSDVAREAGCSEDAAKHRLSYALEKMRDILRRKGVTVQGGALGSVIGAMCVDKVPAGLAAKCCGQVAAKYAGATAVDAIASEAVRMMARQSLSAFAGKAAVVAVSALLAVAVTMTVSRHTGSVSDDGARLTANYLDRAVVLTAPVDDGRRHMANSDMRKGQYRLACDDRHYAQLVFGPGLARGRLLMEFTVSPSSAGQASPVDHAQRPLPLNSIARMMIRKGGQTGMVPDGETGYKCLQIGFIDRSRPEYLSARNEAFDPSATLGGASVRMPWMAGKDKACGLNGASSAAMLEFASRMNGTGECAVYRNGVARKLAPAVPVTILEGGAIRNEVIISLSDRSCEIQLNGKVIFKDAGGANYSALQPYIAVIGMDVETSRFAVLEEADAGGRL